MKAVTATIAAYVLTSAVISPGSSSPAPKVVHGSFQRSAATLLPPFTRSRIVVGPRGAPSKPPSQSRDHAPRMAGILFRNYPRYSLRMSDLELLARSVRTLAWLGDAEFEREVRLRVARRGDWPVKRLDRIRAQVVRAEGQANLLASIEASLSDDEANTVRRARNSSLRGSARGMRNIRAYRAATALEALVALWHCTGSKGQARFRDLLGPPLEAAIDFAVAQSASLPEPQR